MYKTQQEKDEWVKRIRTDYQGPYRISHVRGQMYVLEDLKGRLLGVYHQKRLRPYTEPETTDEEEDTTDDTTRNINMMRISESGEEEEQEGKKERIRRIIKPKKINKRKKGYLMQNGKELEKKEWALIEMSDSDTDAEQNKEGPEQIKIIVLHEITIRENRTEMRRKCGEDTSIEQGR